MQTLRTPGDTVSDAASVVLSESSVLTEAESGKGIWRSRIIEADVQGSSGFYPASVLERDGARAFPARTHVYFDHPTVEEEELRPERSVRDIAGYLVDSARYEDGPDGRGLFARIQLTEEARRLVRDIAPVIGLSIRAAGSITETSGRRVIDSIEKGLSVDLVTRAGAGGKLVNMAESATPETPPAVKNEDPKGGGGTTATGTLVSEVASLRETLSDRIEQQSIELARQGHQLKEAQRDSERRAKEVASIREALTFLVDRQKAHDQMLGEGKTTSEVLTALLEAGLPVPSMLRVAQGYRPGIDLHAEIQKEREYAKKLLRESEKGEVNRETSGLGLTESTLSERLDASTNADLSEIESLLMGGDR